MARWRIPPRAKGGCSISGSREIIQELTARWLGKAEDDLKPAELLLRTGGPTWTIAFHAQQAAEKAVKAIHVFEQRLFPFTHEIAALVSLLPEELREIAVIQRAERLSEFAVASRYPGREPSLSEATGAVDLAKDMLATCRDYLAKFGLELRS